MIDINIIEDDNLFYEYLGNLDYNELDYSDITSLFFIIRYINFKIQLGYNDYCDKLDILKKYSLYCYYQILDGFYPDTYSKLILELEPSNIIETIEYKFLLEKNKLLSNNINIKNTIIDELNLYIDDLTKDNIIINNYYKRKLLFIEHKFSYEPNDKKIIYTINFINNNLNSLDYDKCLKPLEILKNTKIINKDYLCCLEFNISSLINKTIDIDMFLIYHDKLLSNTNNIIREIYIYKKYNTINRIIYCINRSGNEDKKKFLINQIIEIYEQYKKDDKLNEEILSSHMFTSIDYMIYGMMAKYTEDTDIKNKFLKLSIDALLHP